MAKAVVPLLRKQRSGSTIQMTSNSSWISHPIFVQQKVLFYKCREIQH
jgi:hypothetical protein